MEHYCSLLKLLKGFKKDRKNIKYDEGLTKVRWGDGEGGEGEAKADYV